MWKQVLMGSAVVLGGTLISRLFTFLYNTMLIRELSVSDFAVFSLFMSILSWILIFSHFDLYAAVSKFVSESISKGHVKIAWNYHYNAVLLATALSVLGVAAAALLSAKIAASSLYSVFFFFSLIPLSVVTVNDGLIKGYQRFSLSAYVDVSAGFSKFIAVSAFVFMVGVLSLNDVFVLFALASSISLLLSIKFIRKLRSVYAPLSGNADRMIIKRLMSFSKWVCLTDLANTGILLFLNLMLSFYSYQDLARFNVVVLIYSMFQLSYGAITTVLIPKIARLAAQGGKIDKLGRRDIAYMYGMTIVIVIALYYLPYQERILQLFFKKAVYYDSLQYVAVLLFVLPLRIVTMTNKGILQGLEYPGDAARASVISLLGLIAVSLPLYTMFHFNGIIASLLLAYILEFTLYNRAIGNRLTHHVSS